MLITMMIGGIAVSAACMTPAFGQAATESSAKVLITEENRGQIRLTAEQQATLDKVARSQETLRVSVVGVPSKGQRDRGGYARIHLPLADGREVVLVRTQPTVRTERGYTWRGEVKGSGEHAVLMLWDDGHLSGFFGYEGRVFTLSHAGGEIHAMTEIDLRKLPPDHAPDSRGKSAALVRTPVPLEEPKVAGLDEADRRALEAKDITIDVMLLYTRNAAAQHIGNPVDLLALAIEQANETFKNSGIGNIKLRLVHTQPVDYEEADGEHFDHLYRMVDGEGVFKNVRKLRDEKGADIVGLVLHSPSGCGLSTRVGADAEEAFFVVHHSCAAITYSLAHEVGHILGARHDRAVDTNETPFAYAHGHINGTKWRDTMSYQEGCGGCPRIPFWSNPRVLYRGEPTGTVASDNARVILEQAERVSRFR